MTTPELRAKAEAIKPLAGKVRHRPPMPPTRTAP